MIWNSIAITINLVVLITYFIFIPITLASDGKLKLGYFLTIKTIAFLLSSTAILGHFFIVKFALIEDDAPRITLILSIWVAFNLLFENQKGIFFAEMNGSKNIIKMSLSIFFIFSTTCFYLILCPISQAIKNVNEKKERKDIMKTFRESNSLKGGVADAHTSFPSQIDSQLMDNISDEEGEMATHTRASILDK